MQATPQAPVAPQTDDVTTQFLILLRSKVRSLQNPKGLAAERVARSLEVPYTTLRNWIYSKSKPAPWAARTLMEKLGRLK